MTSARGDEGCTPNWSMRHEFMQVLSGVGRAEQIRVIAAWLVWFFQASLPEEWAARSDDDGLRKRAPRKLDLIFLRKGSGYDLMKRKDQLLGSNLVGTNVITTQPC